MMDRWEYKVVRFGGVLSSVKSETVEEALNVLGQEGWEAATSFSTDSGTHALIVLKRLVGGRSGDRKEREAWGRW